MARRQRYRAYGSWCDMRQRCSNPRRREWKRYGGRGIKVCERWSSFENFLEDMGERAEGYSIERVNNDGDYEPANCLWIPIGEQSLNKINSAGCSVWPPPGDGWWNSP